MKSTRAAGVAIMVAMVFMAGSVATAQEHAHKSPHGGQVITVGSYHYEMLVKPGEINLYVLDGKLATLPLKGMEGRLLLQLPDKTKKEVTLQPDGEHLKGAVDLGSTTSFIAIATVKIDGKPNAGRFSYPPKESTEEHHHKEK
ncbi:MAG: hypothetical protein HYT77_03835 [Deltaproteobacteria bacterium]|nr:hypothetical protein [Deltaproteobacteria bacterium]